MVDHWMVAGVDAVCGQSYWMLKVLYHVVSSISGCMSCLTTVTTCHRCSHFLLCGNLALGPQN